MGDIKQLKSLSRAIEIINLLEDHSALSVYEISDILNVPRSTTYKYLFTLREHGFVSYDDKSEKYKLGIRLYILGSNVRSQIKVDRIARPFMEELVEIINETIGLNILNNNVAVILERVGPVNKSGIVFYVKKGRITPLHAGAAGKVLLAFQSAGKINQIIKKNTLEKFTDKTITNPDELMKEIEIIRKEGVAYSDQEITNSARAVAAPIFDIMDEVVASLVIVGPDQRMNEKKISEAKNMVKKYARKISEELKFSS